jgi:hydroxymethylglutaryl-CoA synthase
MNRIGRSPGKIILSGEHSVVQGCPALVLAIPLYAEADFSPLPEKTLKLKLPDRPAKSFELQDLSRVLEQTREAHRLGTTPEPEALLAACAALTHPVEGGSITFNSTLPLGAGLGSSAAFILALLNVLKPQATKGQLYAWAVEGESFQHGNSSGLDVAASLEGGLIFFQSGKATALSGVSLPDFTLYHSGRPESSTGDCVEVSKKYFSTYPDRVNRFTAVTLNLLEALQQSHSPNWSAALRENHSLLCEVGVVPQKIQSEIAQLAKAGFAAKICGAGSIRGSKAGMVLVEGSGPHPVPTQWEKISHH